MKKFQLEDDLSCEMSMLLAHPIKRMEFNPDEFGKRISNGETLVLEVEDDVTSIFAITYAGLLSNEINLSTEKDLFEIRLNTKGGWKTPSYPYLEIVE